MNKKFHGKGALTFKDKDIYIGDFKNGKFDGNGTYKSHKNWSYIGEFNQSKKHG